MSGYNYFQTTKEMNFTIYSKEDCPYCHKVKTVLELTGSKFVVYTLGEDFTREQFYDEFGEGSTFPQVLCDCLLYTSPSPRDQRGSRMPSSA